MKGFSHDWRDSDYLSAFREGYRPRRAHRKSRTGCTNCKRRRIKCDETKPQCKRCRMHGAVCDFTLPPNQADRRLRLCPAGTSLQWNGLLAFSAMTDNVSSLLQAELNDATPLLYGSGDSLGSLGLAMLSHFSQVVVSTHPPAFAPIKKVLREHTIQLALTEPCLLYSILAVASTHRAQLLPPDSKQSIIATRFRHKAARIYRHQLQLPISRENMDMLISSCILIGMFSFSAEASNPLDSWVFSDDPIAMNWLSVQCGLRCMIGLIDPWLDESIWNEAFQASSNYEFYDDHRMGREDLDPDLADLCDISDITTEETNPFHWPLRMLCPLLRMPRHKCGATRITNFMGRLHSDFVNLLTAKEPRALLILSYWLALMYTSVHDWWVDPRVRVECQAICMYLEAWGDKRIVELLDFPARACGYRLMAS
ncbi:Zn(II)2Cys6 transcription factor [Aspergillus alliaceus]|uniref:Zn(II)2Cys6 transcription factor n=1 Tax=Petromyces alliaceus TaxID=209559 RepID=UPI0012A59086|nr:uncharacterized protein BDW43DRAFT_304213 [Aspergillus alliaceus]KAB8227997.1 hypothetical protein BDW43DRAFT_304213 [Aspergillus alliaceus]